MRNRRNPKTITFPHRAHHYIQALERSTITSIYQIPMIEIISMNAQANRAYKVCAGGRVDSDPRNNTSVMSIMSAISLVLISMAKRIEDLLSFSMFFTSRERKYQPFFGGSGAGRPQDRHLLRAGKKPPPPSGWPR